MAYGHAERNLATLRLLQRQADLLVAERGRQQTRSAPEPAVGGMRRCSIARARMA